MNKKEKSIEKAFEELNILIDKMDNPEVSLEESFSLYNEGVGLVKYCNDKIEKVEKAITIVESDND